MHCPSCGCDDVRHSRRRRLLDWMLVALMLRPFRCRTCRSRFYGYKSPVRLRGLRREAKSGSQAAGGRRSHTLRNRYQRWCMRRGRRVTRQAVIAACVLVSVLAFFYLLVYGLALVT